MGHGNPKAKRQHIAYQRELLGSCWNGPEEEQEVSTYLPSRWMGISKTTMALYTGNQCFTIRAFRVEETSVAQHAAAPPEVSGSPSAASPAGITGVGSNTSFAGLYGSFAALSGAPANGSGGGGNAISIEKPAPAAASAAPSHPPLTTIRVSTHESPLQHRKGSADHLIGNDSLHKKGGGAGSHRDPSSPVMDDGSEFSEKSPTESKRRKGKKGADGRGGGGKAAHVLKTSFGQHGRASSNESAVALVGAGEVGTGSAAAAAASAAAGSGAAGTSATPAGGSSFLQILKDATEMERAFHDAHPYLLLHNLSVQQGVIFRAAPARRLYDRIALVALPGAMRTSANRVDGTDLVSSSTLAPPLPAGVSSTPFYSHHNKNNNSSDNNNSNNTSPSGVRFNSAGHMIVNENEDAVRTYASSHPVSVLPYPPPAMHASRSPLNERNNYTIEDVDVPGVQATTPPVIIGTITALELLMLPENAEVCFGGWLYVSMQDEQRRLRNVLEDLDARKKAKQEEQRRREAARLRRRRQRQRRREGRRKGSYSPESTSLYAVSASGADSPRSPTVASSSPPRPLPSPPRVVDEGRRERVHEQSSAAGKASGKGERAFFKGNGMDSSSSSSSTTTATSIATTAAHTETNTTAARSNSPKELLATTSPENPRLGGGNEKEEAPAATPSSTPEPALTPLSLGTLVAPLDSPGALRSTSVGNEAKAEAEAGQSTQSHSKSVLENAGDESKGQGTLVSTTTTTLRGTRAASEDGDSVEAQQPGPSSPLPRHTRANSVPSAPLSRPSGSTRHRASSITALLSGHGGRGRDNEPEEDPVWFPFSYVLVAVPMYECAILPTQFHQQLCKSKPVSLNVESAASRSVFGVGCITAVRYGGAVVLECRDKVTSSDEAWISYLTEVSRMAHPAKSAAASATTAFAAPRRRPGGGFEMPPFPHSSHFSHTHQLRAAKMRCVVHRLRRRFTRSGLYVVTAATREEARSLHRTAQLTLAATTEGIHVDRNSRVPSIHPDFGNDTDRHWEADSTVSSLMGDAGRTALVAVEEAAAIAENDRALLLSVGLDYDERDDDDGGGGGIADADGGEGDNGGVVEEQIGEGRDRRARERYLWQHLRHHHHHRDHPHSSSHDGQQHPRRIFHTGQQRTRQELTIKGTFRQIGGMRFLDVNELLDGCPVRDVVRGLMRWAHNLLLTPIKARPLSLYLQRYEGVANTLRVAPSQLLTSLRTDEVLTSGMVLKNNNLSFTFPSAMPPPSAAPTTVVPALTSSSTSGAGRGGLPTAVGHDSGFQISSFALHGSMDSLHPPGAPAGGGGGGGAPGASPTGIRKWVGFPFATAYNGPLDPTVHAVLTPEVEAMIRAAEQRININGSTATGSPVRRSRSFGSVAERAAGEANAVGEEKEEEGSVSDSTSSSLPAPPTAMATDAKDAPLERTLPLNEKENTAASHRGSRAGHGAAVCKSGERPLPTVHPASQDTEDDYSTNVNSTSLLSSPPGTATGATVCMGHADPTAPERQLLLRSPLTLPSALHERPTVISVDDAVVESGTPKNSVTVISAITTVVPLPADAAGPTKAVGAVPSPTEVELLAFTRAPSGVLVEASEDVQPPPPTLLEKTMPPCAQPPSPLHPASASTAKGKDADGSSDSDTNADSDDDDDDDDPTAGETNGVHKPEKKRKRKQKRSEKHDESDLATSAALPAHALPSASAATLSHPPVPASSTSSTLSHHNHPQPQAPLSQLPPSMSPTGKGPASSSSATAAAVVDNASMTIESLLLHTNTAMAAMVTNSSFHGGSPGAAGGGGGGGVTNTSFGVTNVPLGSDIAVTTPPSVVQAVNASSTPASTTGSGGGVSGGGMHRSPSSADTSSAAAAAAAAAAARGGANVRSGSGSGSGLVHQHVGSSGNVSGNVMHPPPLPGSVHALRRSGSSGVLVNNCGATGSGTGLYGLGRGPLNSSDLIHDSGLSTDGAGRGAGSEPLLSPPSEEWLLADRELRAVKSELEEMQFLVSNANAELAERVEEYVQLGSLFMPHTRIDQLSLSMLFVKMLRQYPEEVPVKELNTDWLPTLFALLTTSHHEIFCTEDDGELQGGRQRLAGRFATYNHFVDPDDVCDANRRNEQSSTGGPTYTVERFPALPPPQLLRDVIVAPQPYQLTADTIQALENVGVDSGLSFYFTGGSLGVLAGLLRYYSDFLCQRYEKETQRAREGGYSAKSSAELLTRGNNVFLNRVWLWGATEGPSASRRKQARQERRRQAAVESAIRGDGKDASSSRGKEAGASKRRDSTGRGSGGHGAGGGGGGSGGASAKVESATTLIRDRLTAIAQLPEDDERVGLPFSAAETFALFDAIVEYLHTYHRLEKEFCGLRPADLDARPLKRRSRLTALRRSPLAQAIGSNSNAPVTAASRDDDGAEPAFGNRSNLSVQNSSILAARGGPLLVETFEVCVATDYYYKQFLQQQQHQQEALSTRHRNCSPNNVSDLGRTSPSRHSPLPLGLLSPPQSQQQQQQQGSKADGKRATSSHRFPFFASSSSSLRRRRRAHSAEAAITGNHLRDRKKPLPVEAVEQPYCGGEEMNQHSRAQKEAKRLSKFLQEQLERWRSRQPQNSVAAEYAKRIRVSLS